MKRVIIIVSFSLLIVLIIVAVFIGYRYMSVAHMTDEELVEFYNDNHQIINKIKNELLSSGYDDVWIYWESNKIICRENGEDLNIPSIYDELVEYFEQTNKRLSPCIQFINKSYERLPAVEFSFFARRVTKGIVYSKVSVSKNKIDDDWYTFVYAMPH